MPENIQLHSQRLEALLSYPGCTYRGSRFDWTGFITQVTLDGQHTFCIPESLQSNTGSGGSGLCTEFGIDLPVGYDEAHPGELFPKLGIGLLRRPDNEAYSFGRTYEVAQPFPMQVETCPDQVNIRIEPIDCHGFAARLVKTIRLRENKLETTCDLHNTGQKAILTHEYAHNFVAIDRQPVGPDYRLHFPYPVSYDEKATVSLDMLDIQGSEVGFNNPLASLYLRPLGYAQTANPQWEMTLKSNGVGLREVDDFTPMRVAVWGTFHVLSPEIFVGISLQPGAYTIELTPASIEKKMSDKEILRVLATRWMELASLPVMAERQRLWTALKDLHAERPMALFETLFLEDYVRDEDLACQDPFFREVEKGLRWEIRHVEEVGDDTVLPPEYRVYWDIDWPDYGVPIPQNYVTDGLGGHSGFNFDHPFKTPQDVERLKPRTWSVDREKTRRRLECLQETFGDILPVVLHGTPEQFHCGITKDLFMLAGNDNLLKWVYDSPQAIQQTMAFLRDDRLAYFDWLEKEGLLGVNNDWGYIGAGSPGATTNLPAPGYAGQARVKDMWIWMESQETTMISPRMFEKFFLPYMAELCKRVGLVYYGCCEPVHDRWEAIRKAIPNIRAVSIPAWADQRIMGEKLGKQYIYSRKPKTWLISTDNPDWDAIRQDLEETLAAARNCNLEIIYRDVYRLHDNQKSPMKWMEMVKAMIN